MNQTTQLLLSCLKLSDSGLTDSDAKMLLPEEWAAVVDLAERQHVTPLLYDRLQARQTLSIIPQAQVERLKAAHRANALRNMHLFHHLHQILAAFAAHDIPVMVLKGAFLAHAVYNSPTQRLMLDIDILVQEANLAQGAELLIQLGYQPNSHIALDASVKLRHHLPRFVMSGNPISIELHWTIASIEQSYAVPMDEFWRNSTSLPFINGTMTGFGYEDLLLHVCIHASYHHLFIQGVRPLCDIDALVRRFERELDWQIVRQYAVKRHWQRGVYMTLYLAKQYMGTPIPNEVMNELRPEIEAQHLIEAAVRQMFPAEDSPPNATVNLAKAWGEQNLTDKARLILQRFFPSQSEMALAYPADSNSWRIYLYYPVRFVTLLSRYSQRMWMLWRGDGQLQAHAQRQLSLSQWLGLS